MCGIAGFVRTCAPQADGRVLKRMGDVIVHRGPDAGGEYMDDRVGLAHRRLSIIDLSHAGNQPMVSSTERFVIVFNGEIYNFLDLRSDLERNGCVFRSRTDTEVILALYEREGASCLDRMNGMFAFAIWDREEKTLFLARDRIGKKPLYYFHGGSDRVAFASEIKSILEIPGISREIDSTAIADFMKYLYIPAPKTIFRNIFKLLPGHCMMVRSGGEPEIREYWDVKFTRSGTKVNEDDAAEELLNLIGKSTRCRMISDVPLGAFLSGGIDSSAIVAVMARSSSERVKTCSIGFREGDHDETPYAREIAKRFNTEHVEYFVQRDLPETVSLLPKYLDEPFADSSAVPTFHVSRLARRMVTVALAGDGGDESFGGYEKYSSDFREDQVRRLVPRALLRTVKNVTRALPGILMRKAHTLAGGALERPDRAFYRTNSFIGDEELHELLSGRTRSECHGYDPGVHTSQVWEKVRDADHTTCMLYTDLKTYLPGDILVKVDRMSMAHSLEVRAPFLDYRVIEYAASLPSSMKIKGGGKKYILKKALKPLLPETILHRRKHGFTVPLDKWFRGELRSISERNLFRNASMGEYFSIPYMRRVWDEHQSKKRNHGTLLWSLLSFSLWHRTYMESSLPFPQAPEHPN